MLNLNITLVCACDLYNLSNRRINLIFKNSISFKLLFYSLNSVSRTLRTHTSSFAPNCTINLVVKLHDFTLMILLQFEFHLNEATNAHQKLSSKQHHQLVSQITRFYDITNRYNLF